MFTPVTHVLFDMDGLLISTANLYEAGFQKVASKYGKEFTFDMSQQILGLQMNEYADKIIKLLKLPLTREKFLAECFEEFKVLFPKAEFMPGARRLVEHLHRHKVPIGLASCSSLKAYNLKVSKMTNFFELFDFKTLGSVENGVKQGKPHPDIFLVAAAKFPDKPKAGKCLVFEDAVNGVKAARAAGMQVVMVPDRRLERTFTTDATLVLDSLEDFQPELFGLPPFSPDE